ncbi:MAG: PAS domain S-box protein [Pseudomonadota bacterium]
MIKKKKNILIKRKTPIPKKINESIITRDDLNYLLSASSAVIYKSKATGDFGATFITDNVKDVMGYKPEEFLKNSSFWLDHIHPDDKKRVLAGLPAIFKKGYLSHEYLFHHKNGEYLWVTDQMKLIKDKKGRPLEIIGYWSDISKYKKMEEDILVFKKFADFSGQGFGMANLAGDIIYVNPALSQIFEEDKPEDSLKKNIRNYYSKKTYKQLKQTTIPIVMKKGKWSGESEIISAQGNKISVIENIFYIPDKKGKPQYLANVITDITERKRIETELLKEKTFSQTIMNTLPGIFFIMDIEGKMVQWNKNLEEVTGYSTEKISKMTPLDFLPEEEKEKVAKAIQSSFEQGFAKTETVILSKRDKKIPYYFIGSSLKIDNNTYVVAIGVDISERKIAEEEYIKEWQFSEIAINSIPGIFYLFNEKGNFLRWNSNFEKISEYSPQEIAKMNPLDFFEGEDKGRVAAVIKDVLDTGIGDVEANFISKSKKRPQYYFTGSRMTMGDKMYVIGTGIDITKRKIAENKVEETKDYLDNLIDKASAPIVVWDSENKITRFNRAFEQLSGYKADEVVGNKSSFFFPEDKKSEALIDKSSIPIEIPILSKDGNIHTILWSFANIFAEDDKTIIRTIAQGQNITERSKAERRLKMALANEHKAREIMTSMLEDNNLDREQLEKNVKELKQTQAMLVQSEKLSSLGKLASDMAHEVNNPLMVISGNAQILLMDKQLDKEIEDGLQTIIEQCMRARDIMQRLLKFSKPSRGDVTDVDVNQSLDFVIGLIERQYALENVIIKRNYMNSPPKIKIDEKQMHEVFINLLKNAKEAMQDGGTITISTSVVKDVIQIDFADEGCGISEQNLNKMFEPFFTTKEEGTGLGLAICYGIIKAHNGDMKYMSEPGKRTTATIILPMGG